MKVKIAEAPKAAASSEPSWGFVLSKLAMTLTVIIFVGLLFWWLVPIATAGAVGMTFFQGVALAGVLHLGRVLLAPTKK